MEIVKICKKHGELNEDQVRLEKIGNGRTTLRCLQCKSEKDKRFYEKNPDYFVQKATEWKRENREKYNAWFREDRKNNPGKYSRWSKKYKDSKRDLVQRKEVCRIHGLTLDEYEVMVNSQKGLCMICKQPETRKSKVPGQVIRLAVDHCHKTNKVRDLLCGACNTGIGKFGESINRLESAIAYLRKWGAT